MRKIVVLTAAVLTMALLATAVAAAERKAKDKPKADEKTAPCGCAAETKKGDTREVICVMQKTGDYGSYCLYYALHVGCVDPVPYYGDCGLLGIPPTPQDCAGGSNCISARALTKVRSAKGRPIWKKDLAEGGYKTKPKNPEPVQGVLSTEAYVEFSKNPSGGPTLFAKIFRVQMFPAKFSTPYPEMPPIEETHGFQVDEIPAGALKFSVGNKEVYTLERDKGTAALVKVVVHSKDNVWIEYNILLDAKELEKGDRATKRKR